jgi:protein PhnA
LEVKGSQVKANVGVAVRNIRLVHDNIEQIEGKVDGQQIVILTKFVKKS